LRLPCIAVALALLVVPFGCSGQQEERIREEKPLPVRTATVKVAPKKRSYEFTGVAAAAERIPLGFRIGGRIASVAVSRGESVQKGDVIARLEPRDYVLARERRRADLQRAQAELDNARAEFERVRSLYEIDNVSERERDRARSTFEAARAQVEKARNGVELARRKVAYCTLRAPVSGEIAHVPAQAHQVVRSGQTVAVLLEDSETEVRVGVPERFVNRVGTGQRARAAFSIFPGDWLPVEVTEIGAETDRTTTYPVTLRFLSPHPRIKPGMVARVRFSVPGSEGDGVVVPPNAVIGGYGGERSVWVLDRGTVHRREVQPGSMTPEGLLLRDGPPPGSRVVVRGAHSMEEGMRVRPLGEEDGP
jgi:RND family efflux transporter MFP subunit